MIRRHRVLVIGRNGQLAQALAAAEWPNLTGLYFAGRDEIDLFCPPVLRQQIAAINPEIIINTAGFARVDLAEQDPEAAFTLNATAVQLLAEAASRLDIPLIHLSTAHVFAGDKQSPYRENDEPEPSSMYGQSMAAGETAIRRAYGRYLILRTSRLFGLHGDNFLKTMLAFGRDTAQLSFTANGYACPTPTEALAEVIPHIALAMMEGRRFPSILHYAGNEAASWYEIANEVFTLAGRFQPVPNLVPINATAPRETLPRISNLTLDSSLAYSLGLPRIDWRAALRSPVEALCQSDTFHRLVEQASLETAPSLAAVFAT